MRTALLLASLLFTSSALAANDGPTIPTDPGGGFDPVDPPTPTEVCTYAIANKLTDLASHGINLGAPTSTLQWVGSGATRWCYQTFQFGRVHTAPIVGSGVAAMHGAVIPKFLALGGETGFGRALSDTRFVGEGTFQLLLAGSIIVHPSVGSRVIRNPLDGLWGSAGAEARFGFPTADTLANPFGTGSYSPLERGYVARNTDMGSWIDFTGAGEGRVNASVTLFRDVGFAGSTLPRSLSGESPVALRAQFGALDEATSSMVLSLPTRSSLYVYDQSPLEGRFMRITGADDSLIRVSSIGTFMNDRASSMVIINHGTASSKTTAATLATEIQTNLDVIGTEELVDGAFAGTEASGSLTWNSDVGVELIPGERLIQFTRRGYLNVNGPWWTDGDGDVLFTVTVRPQLSWNGSRQLVRVQLVEGTAISLSCSGSLCDERQDALDGLFGSLSVRTLIEETFANAFATKLTRLGFLEVACPGVGVRRVNILPDALEVVVADTAAQAVCAMPLAATELDFARPVAQVTLRNAPSLFPLPTPTFDGTITVAPYFPTPPIVKK